MLCRVEMPTNEQIYGRFYRYKILHREDRSSRGNFFMIVMVMVAMCVVMFFLGIDILWILAMVGILGLYIWYSLWIQPTSVFRKKSGIALQTEVYIFTENGYTRTVKHEEGGIQDNTSGQYTGLTRAVETSKDFYIYTSPKQAYLVDKEYFTNGTPEDLRVILQKALGAKFKAKKG